MNSLFQVIRPALLQQGFELVRREELEVTDDVSIIEALGEPVHITLGTYTNIKVSCHVQSGGLLGDSAAPRGPLHQPQCEPLAAMSSVR